LTARDRAVSNADTSRRGGRPIVLGDGQRLSLQLGFPSIVITGLTQ